MNEQELIALVHRARAAETATAQPPADLVRRAAGARTRRRAMTATITVTILAVVVVTGGIVAAGRGPTRSDSTGDPGTRLVGANGIVLAVPATWSTQLEQGSFCGASVSRQVNFFLVTPGAAIGSCGGEIGASSPPEHTLSVATDGLLSSDVTPQGPPAGTVGGMPYWIVAAPHAGPGVAEAEVVPQAEVEFVVGAATEAEADALLATIRPVPAGMTLVSLATKGYPGETGTHLNSFVVEPAADTHLRATTSETYDAGHTYAGDLVGTDPPVGTPVRPGSAITILYAAGDIGDYVSDADLTGAGWDVTPADRFDPAITRPEAFDAVPDKFPDGSIGGVYGLFLRRLDGRLVYIVAIVRPDHMIRFTAVDATTGAVVRDHVFPLLPS